jgi:hypothetical protein
MAHQFYKSIVTDRMGEIVPHMNAHMALVTHLETAVATEMKQQDNGHHFA